MSTAQPDRASRGARAKTNTLRAGDERAPCCVTAGSRCGTRFDALRAWTCKHTGKGVRIVNETRGKAPCYAQPVGYDGRSFWVARDHGCDTEKLLHEVCHFVVAPKTRRNRENYGLGPGVIAVTPVESDNEEVTVMLLEALLAPTFGLDLRKIARPDYNTHDRRNVDWSACELRASELLAQMQPTLP
ncbi:MAG: hypothetical protein Q8Q09_17835 [Deltaproteobacteria bacterium]|nr:hypothetical protein [Deltaproteobacteria bacterium]